MSVPTAAPLAAGRCAACQRVGQSWRTHCRRWRCRCSSETGPQRRRARDALSRAGAARAGAAVPGARAWALRGLAGRRSKCPCWRPRKPRGASGCPSCSAAAWAWRWTGEQAQVQVEPAQLQHAPGPADRPRPGGRRQSLRLRVLPAAHAATRARCSSSVATALAPDPAWANCTASCCSGWHGRTKTGACERPARTPAHGGWQLRLQVGEPQGDIDPCRACRAATGRRMRACWWSSPTTATREQASVTCCAAPA